jgi:DHA1 family bicyclomycin/chloramphenicol resistance-like MFS transporter
VVADIVSGPAAARAFTLMLTVGGVAPVLAPLVGGILADPVGWRGMLWAVVLLCAVMLVGVLVAIPETHPADRRAAGAVPVIDAMRRVVGNSAYRGPVAVFACSFAVMMAYISASPFVYQNVVGLSELGYGLAFGVNALGLIGAGWVTSRMVGRTSPRRMVRAAIAVQLCASLAFVGLALVDAPVWLLPVPIFVAVTSNGAIMGNSAALAMDQVREVAGAGSAVLGFSQFALGALVSPLVGLGGESSAVVPALVMATASVLGFTASRVSLPR